MSDTVEFTQYPFIGLTKDKEDCMYVERLLEFDADVAKSGKKLAYKLFFFNVYDEESNLSGFLEGIEYNSVEELKEAILEGMPNFATDNWYSIEVNYKLDGFWCTMMQVLRDKVDED